MLFHLLFSGYHEAEGSVYCVGDKRNGHQWHTDIPSSGTGGRRFYMVCHADYGVCCYDLCGSYHEKIYQDVAVTKGQSGFTP